MVLLGAAGPARGADTLRNPPSPTVPPPGHQRSADAVGRVADQIGKVRRARRRHPGSFRRVFLKGGQSWQVSYYDRTGRKEIAQVMIDDLTGGVVEAWTGIQVPWAMARGYPGAFGRKVNALFVWLPLCVLFLAPFLSLRRRPRIEHLDLLVLLSFSVSLAFFNHAEIGASVPLAYPPLLYLLARMLWIGLRGRRGQGLELRAPPAWAAVGLLFLVGFRVGLNVVNSNVIDVGYAGVIGGHHLLHGTPLYGHFPADNVHGDTYGPVAYLVYLPAVLLFGWSGTWDALPAAHATALVFDLGTLGAIYVLGRRLAGRRLALGLAWAWAAYPFTAFSLMSNSNDVLVSLLAVLALLVAARPAARGAMVALAGLAKFAPLALGPVLLRDPDDGRLGRRALVYTAAGLAVTVALVAPVLLSGDGHTFWTRTIAYQSDRDSPFSVWGYFGWATAQKLVQLAGVGLCLALALIPRPRDMARTAALAAAALIALQLGVSHWFYLYLVWFFPLVMVALMAPAGAPARSTAPGAAPARSG